ncbi:hypothetical protein CAPTEDRAFT_193565 [Capitella teleta]|uniref:Uncharacterized protein n=1 Tax=Capitella teleta TaxID=283909 RepID=R7UQ60_CAPTE|nr:hypothetical protein CAPTEDRAFT_193565 [Capitella teleta]|eukprot:ELU08248.1 hypothetical protein CAPTEDRAFT_193565 [Capitella teleta]
MIRQIGQENAEIKGCMQQILHVVASSAAASAAAPAADDPLPAQTLEDVLMLKEWVSADSAFKSALVAAVRKNVFGSSACREEEEVEKEEEEEEEEEEEVGKMIARWLRYCGQRRKLGADA